MTSGLALPDGVRPATLLSGLHPGPAIIARVSENSPHPGPVSIAGRPGGLVFTDYYLLKLLIIFMISPDHVLSRLFLVIFQPYNVDGSYLMKVFSIYHNFPLKPL